MKITIEQEHRIPIKELIRIDNRAEVVKQCEKSLLKQAIEDGDREQALDLLDRVETAKDNCSITHEQLWSYIQERYPMSAPGGWSIDYSKWVLHNESPNSCEMIPLKMNLPPKAQPFGTEPTPAPTAA